MKKYFVLLWMLVLANFFFGCEKDDICEAGTPTTSRMIVEFYDNLNPNTKKSITNLGIVASGLSTGILFNGVSKIEVPLKTDIDNVTYSFILDSQNTDVLLRNEDKITINYTRNDVYISRACGFKTVFVLNKTNAIPIITDSNNWIKEIQVAKNNILNEDEIHVKIFF
jgi:Family of unknown function (DUF6452)